MTGRATRVAEAGINVVVAALAMVSHHARAWVKSGDTTLMVVLGVIAILLLLAIVVPSRRRY